MSDTSARTEEGRREIGRLRLRSRRGMLELELALLPFVERRLVTLSPAERRLYGQLLEHDDWDVFDWIQGRSTPGDPALASLVEEIRAANTP